MVTTVSSNGYEEAGEPTVDCIGSSGRSAGRWRFVGDAARVRPVDAVAALLAEPAGRRVEWWDVAGLRSIAHLVGKSKGRCGIYVLAFGNGECYLGQAVDVTSRFVTHAHTYPDIIRVYFWRVPQPDLDAVERAEIHRLQRAGVLLRNVVHASGRLGASAFDTLVPPDEQQLWLTSNPSDDTGVEVRPDEAGVRRRGQLKYRRLVADPRFGPLLPALRRYVAWTVPLPRRTELAYWAVSAVPGTGKYTVPRLLTLSVHQLETCIVNAPRGRADETVVWINVDLPTLLARWGSLDALMDACPGVYASVARYTVRPDVASLEVESSCELLRLLEVDAVVPAARRLNLDLMRKGPTLHWQTHNFALADDLFAPAPAPSVDPAAHDGVGITLAKRAEGAVDDDELDAAARWYRKAADAGYTPALIDLGRVYLDLDRPQDAERCLLESVAAGETAGYVSLGQLCEQHDDLDGAADWYRRAVELGNPFGMTGLGAVHAARGEHEAATTWYRKAAAVGDGYAMCLLGEQHEQAGEIEFAKRRYTEAVTAGFKRGLLYLGDMYYNLGRLDDARPVYQQAADAGFGEGSAVLGSMYEEVGEFDQAERCYRQAIEDDEETARVDLGALLVRRGKEAAGLEYLHRAAEDGDGDAMACLGEYHEQRGDLDLARQWYQRAVDAGGDDVGGCLHRLDAIIGG